MCSAAAQGSIVSSTRRWVLLARSALAIAAAVSLVAPAPSGAQEDGPSEGNDQARQNRAQIDVDIDVLRVDDVEVTQALGDLAENVAAQQAELDAAELAVMEAEAALAEADGAVAEAQARMDGLSAMTDLVVIEAFMSPPAEAGLDALSAQSLSEASVKQSILNAEATSDAALLDEFQTAEAELEVEMANKEEAAAAAAGRQSEAEAALADLESALSQAAQFAAEVERRLDQRLAEAGSLADIDPELAAQILARESELAAVLTSMQEEARTEAAQALAAQLAQHADAQSGYGTIKDPPGGVVSVPCPAGGSIQVAGDISGAVGRLVDDAAADGVTMCGNGFRDPQDQINLRRSNCGSGNYSIYQAPSSSCSPPTARPGTSLHEQGLAIDFTCGGGGTVGYGDSCHTWLESNAATYGLYNLPGEPWHYSVDGN